MAVRLHSAARLPAGIQRRWKRTPDGYIKYDRTTADGTKVEMPNDTAFGSNPQSFRGQGDMMMATEPRVFDIDDKEAAKKLVKRTDPGLAVNTAYDMDHEFYFKERKGLRDRQTVPGEVALHIEHPEDERRVREGQLIVPETWEDVGLDPEIAALAREWVGASPSTVQKDVLPAMINITDRDLMFSAVTGTGKTLAYCLAALQAVTKDERGITLILVPSEQLAFQVYANILKFSRKGEIFGRNDKEWLQLHICDPNESRDDLYDDYRRLRSTWYGGPRIVIAQHERWADYLLRYRLKIPIRRIIIDEALAAFKPLHPETATKDERYERTVNPMAADIVMSYYLAFPAFKEIMRAQITLLTATFDDVLESHVRRYLKPNQWSHLTTRCTIPSSVDQQFVLVDGGDTVLPAFLNTAHAAKPQRAIVFVTDDLMPACHAAMQEAGMNVRAHGGPGTDDAMPIPFHDKSWNYLLMRPEDCYGIDLPNISHVFVLGVPESREEYTHMVGRTGRFGNAGKAVSFVQRDQVEEWHLPLYLMDIKWAGKAVYPNGVSAEEEVAELITRPQSADAALLATYENAVQLHQKGIVEKTKRRVLYKLAGMNDARKASPTTTLAKFFSAEERERRPKGVALTEEEKAIVRDGQRREFIAKAGSLGLFAHREAQKMHYEQHRPNELRRKAFELVMQNRNGWGGKRMQRLFSLAVKNAHKEARFVRHEMRFVEKWGQERLLAQFPTTDLAPDGEDPNPTVPVVSKRIRRGGTPEDEQQEIKIWPLRKDVPAYPGAEIDKERGTFDWELHHTTEEMSPEATGAQRDDGDVDIDVDGAPVEEVVVPASAREVRMMADGYDTSPPRARGPRASDA